MAENSEKHTKNEGDDTMASIAKPTDKVFILDASKASQFLNQDNHKAQTLLKKFNMQRNKDGMVDRTKK